MKVFTILSLMFSFGTYANSLVEKPEEVTLDVEKVYVIENGFDDNDLTEVAVVGKLPSTCYQVKDHQLFVNERTKEIYITVKGYRYNSDMCIQVQVPFVHVVKIGLLPAGRYHIASASNPSANGYLNVIHSTSSNRDDFVYAPVDSAHINVMGLNASLEITGTYPYFFTGCMRVVDLKTFLTDNNILVVQPVSEIYPTDDKCNPEAIDTYNRFKISKELPQMISGEGLVHVRTMNGTSFNKLVNFEPVR